MKLCIRYIHAILLLLLYTSIASAAVKITGKVVDKDSSQPIWYANVLLFSDESKKQVNGIATSENGTFSLTDINSGAYFIEIHFIGYNTHTSDIFNFNPTDNELDMGQIFLEPNILSTESIQVEGNRSSISYQIDKKVISVDQLSTAISGTAADVLENVPSVTVDIEGNVSLRGSGSFSVLVDGRPTILEPSEVLQQIPASTIDNIEIITNPSVKHDPSGAAGIINIIMKKNKNLGASGVVSANGGLGNKYGGDIILEYRNPDYRATFSIDYNNRDNDGTQVENKYTRLNGVTSYVDTDGSRIRSHQRMGIRGEFEYKFSALDIASLGLRSGKRNSYNDNRLDFTTWNTDNPTQVLETNITDSERGGNFYSIFSDYVHKFDSDGHEIVSKLSYSYQDGEEKSLYKLLDSNQMITSGQASSEKGPGKELEVEIEYTLPFDEKGKFEAGYEVEIDNDVEDTFIKNYNNLTEEFDIDPAYNKSTEYTRKTQSVFALFANQYGNFGVQGGLRGEYTGRDIRYSGVQAANIDRWDYFPSLHTSYQFQEGQQAMASYSRRINRARGWYLEPFETWIDAVNVRIGNPAIQPEYVDSYEMGFLTHVAKTLLSSEFYYRHTKNKIEYIRSAYPDKENTTLQTIQNIGQDFSFGSELLINTDLLKEWNLNLIGNFYNYRVEGIRRTSESFTWNSRVNNKIKFANNVQFQLDGIYNSSSVSSQGKREAFFITNAALRFDFLNRTLSATFQVRDIFATGKWEFTTDNGDYYSRFSGSGEAPVFMLNIRYLINNFKDNQRNPGEGGGDMGGDEEGF